MPPMSLITEARPQRKAASKGARGSYPDRRLPAKYLLFPNQWPVDRRQPPLSLSRAQIGTGVRRSAVAEARILAP